MYTVSAIGQDSHAFGCSGKPLVLGGVHFTNTNLSLRANSDGDVILHALTNAVSGVTCKNILGAVSDKMCRDGVTSSVEYLKVALKDLKDGGWALEHISFSVECAEPKISPRADDIRKSVGKICGLSADRVGITATTGEGLTPFGKKEGISVFCIITASKADCE